MRTLTWLGCIGAAATLAIGQTEKVQEPWMPAKEPPAAKKPWGFGPKHPGFANPWRVRSMGEAAPQSPVPAPADAAFLTPLRRVPPGGHTIPGYTPVYISEGSGLTVNARYESDRWRLGIHLGSPIAYTRPIRRSECFGYGCARSSCYDPCGGRAIDGMYYAYASWNAPDWSSPSPPTPPAPPAAAPPAMIDPPTILEQARAAMREGGFDEAVTLYRAHLATFADDVATMRELGVALIRDGRPADGIAVNYLAYKTDPTLARTPLKLDYMGDRVSTQLRRLVNTCVTVANRDRTAQAWLAVAIFMQAEGRDEPALNMIERARGMGLDPIIADAMAAELTP